MSLIQSVLYIEVFLYCVLNTECPLSEVLHHCSPLTGDKFLCDGHEVVVVGIGHVELTSGELWVVGQINTCREWSFVDCVCMREESG